MTTLPARWNQADWELDPVPILSHAPGAAKAAVRTPSLVAMSDAEFRDWARVEADRLAWEHDGGDPEDHPGADSGWSRQFEESGTLPPLSGGSPVADVPPAIHAPAPAACPPLRLDADDHRPTAGPDYTPTAWEDAYWAGFTLRLEGNGPADAPGHFDPIRRADFLIGQVDGFLELLRREREEQFEADREADERYEAAFGDPVDRYHPAEVIEAAGVGALRGIGGAR